MIRSIVLAAATAVSLLAVSGAGGAAPQTPSSGGTVVVALPSSLEPACLNWVVVSECGGVRPAPLDAVFKGALEPGPHGYRSVLISRATFTKTPPFTVTFTIRPKARWSDGRPVTASDFVFSYRVLHKYGGPFGVDALHLIRSMSALDPKTVRVTYRSKTSYWRSESTSGLPRALPRHALLGENMRAIWQHEIDNPRTGAPIGDGPFLLRRWDRGRQLILVRNPRYWGPHLAFLHGLVFRFVSDPGEALRSGDADLIGSPDPLSQGAALDLARRPQAGIKVDLLPGPSWEHIEIRVDRGGNEMLRDKLVRRAIAYGIDRGALVRTLYGDVAPKLRPLDNTQYLPNEPQYQPNWSMYRHRPAHARALLRQAGCGLGDQGIFVCAGQPLSLRLITTAGVAARAQAVQIIQTQLRSVGIEVVPEYAPGSALLGAGGILERGDFDLALFALSRGSPDSLINNYGCGFPGNFSGYCSRLYTADIVQLAHLVDPERQAAVSNRADRRLARDVPVIPLFQKPLAIAYRTTIHGVVPSAFGDPTWNAENWWLDR